MLTLEEEQLQADKTAGEERRRIFTLELSRRRIRVVRFYVSHSAMETYRWEWMIGRCRNWSEVERVLNMHHVDWDREHGRIVGTDFEVCRCN